MCVSQNVRWREININKSVVDALVWLSERFLDAENPHRVYLETHPCQNRMIATIQIIFQCAGRYVDTEIIVVVCLSLLCATILEKFLQERFCQLLVLLVTKSSCGFFGSNFKLQFQQ